MLPSIIFMRVGFRIDLHVEGTPEATLMKTIYFVIPVYTAGVR